ncbi:MAG TPA: class I SAM-dependent RNA methyltransferase [Bryobacteraceae bacterium]|jgi:23S rRNA (uracil1939-C5)-methyltransferase|nr:class I SAM-dependent RNA methyltransferase [Bryobacteraceae bacterium]
MTPKINKRSGEVSQVQIEKLVYGGEGLARVNGQVLLMPFVLPGEHVSVHTQQVKSGLLRGSGVEILESAAERVTPLCKYFGTCGGCDYQHAQYEFQLAQKQAILRETLQRLGAIQYADEIHVISGREWEYRNRIQLHFADGQVGFHRAGTHELCAIDHCPISSPKLNEVIATLAGAVRRPEWPSFLRSLEVFTNETDVQLNIVDTTRPVAARFFDWCGSLMPGLVRNAIAYEANGHKFRISRGSFFQVNRFLIEGLLEEVIGYQRGRTAVDLYAGVGLFSLPLAERFEQVQAIERGGPAYRDLETNAADLRERLKPQKSSAEEFLASIESTPDLIVADPPRAGLGKDVTRELLRIRPGALNIVSCDPSTLARDAKKLLEAYQISRIALVDLFPQTYHFEVVMHLERK